MKKHKHLFKKVSDVIVELNEIDALNEMFHLHLKEDMGKTKQKETTFRCKCGAEQKFIDQPEHYWNSTLPDSFEMEET